MTHRSKRIAAVAFAGFLTIGGAAACSDDADDDGVNDDLESDVSDAGDDLSEGADDLSEEIEDQVDEGSEEDREPEGG